MEEFPQFRAFITGFFQSVFGVEEGVNIGICNQSTAIQFDGVGDVVDHLVCIFQRFQYGSMELLPVTGNQADVAIGSLNYFFERSIENLPGLRGQ